MANKVVLYSSGNNLPLAGSSDGDKLTWSSATSEWISAAGNSGTVTSITAGTGLSGGTITTTGTIALAALSPDPSGSYGSASSVAAVTVDAYGRVTAASSTGIEIAASAITSGQLGVANGGTGASTLTQYAVLLGNGTSAVATAAPSASTAGFLASNGSSANPSFRVIATTDLPAAVVLTSGSYADPAWITSLAASKVTAIPYDIAGSAAGTPTVSVDCFYFIAVRACSILASGHRAKCKTAPSGTTTFTLNLNGASIGTVQYTVAGGTIGTVTITSGPVAVADGDVITLTAPANLNGLVDPYFTFKATIA